MMKAANNPAIEAANSSTFETWLGRNVLGAIAALLVLTGLCLLGATFVPFLPEIVKAALVSAFAILLTVAGALAVRRWANGFSLALLLCGAGALLVSIILAHSTFNVIGASATFWLIAAWAFACLGIAWVTRSATLAIATMVVAVLFGFEFANLYTPMPGLEVLLGCAVIAAFAALMWLLVEQRRQAGTLPVDARNAHVGLIAGCETGLLSLAFASDWTYGLAAVLLVAMVALLVLANLPVAKTDARYYVPIRINEIVVVLMAALLVSLASDYSVLSAVLHGCALACALVLAALRVRELPQAEQGSAARKPAVLVLGALAPTFYLMGYLYGCTHLVDEPYAYSVVLMACALAMIAAGFFFRAAPLRLCGLVVNLLCVFKLVTVDVAGLDSLARVGAFVAGGIICFAISAFYNYLSRLVDSGAPRAEQAPAPAAVPQAPVAAPAAQFAQPVQPVQAQAANPRAMRPVDPRMAQPAYVAPVQLIDPRVQ